MRKDKNKRGEKLKSEKGKMPNGKRKARFKTRYRAERLLEK